MAISKPSIPKGTRDFSAEQVSKRNFIFDTIRRVFTMYGFQPLETPAMENLSVLTGKYGEEGDQLLFKIINSGNFLADVTPDDIAAGTKKVLPKIAEKGLRYDLTVPFARYVVMNRSELTLPFKRYQIQPVWRADRPQKGRYREFYQCDADVVGTQSLLCEVEIVSMIIQTLRLLGINDYTIKLNNRKILAGIAQAVGVAGKETALCVAIDKLDKIGREKVEEELIQNNFSRDAIAKLQPIFELKGNHDDKLMALQQIFENTSPIGLKGVEEINSLFNLLEVAQINIDTLQLDLTLARGLGYYTGAIFEVKVNNVQIGSISGGGRYDNLTGTFGLEGVPGVGFSFGVDRIYDVMNELDLFPNTSKLRTDVVFTQFDKDSRNYLLPLLYQVREKGKSAEIYPDAVKIKKQLDYANAKNAQWVVLAGSQEMAEQKVTIKNMETGEQTVIPKENFINFIS